MTTLVYFHGFASGPQGPRPKNVLTEFFAY